MKYLTIKVGVSDKVAAYFAERDMMVTPVSEAERSNLGVALDAVENVLRLNCKCLATLREVEETKGIDLPHVSKTLNMMAEPNRLTLDQIAYIRTLLGHSAIVGRPGPAQEEIQ